MMNFKNLYFQPPETTSIDVESLVKLKRKIVLLKREEWQLRDFEGEPPDTVFISQVVESMNLLKSKYENDWFAIKDLAKILKFKRFRDWERIYKVLEKIYPELGFNDPSQFIKRRNYGIAFFARPWMVTKWKTIYCE